MRARRRRILDGFFRAAALAFCALQCGGAAAADLRVGAGVDVAHKQGTVVGALRYGPASAFLWHDNYALALTYELEPRKGWQAGLGVFVVGRTDEHVGTHLNGVIRLGYCFGRFCISGLHVSHGSTVGIARDKPNSGLNFLMLEVR